MWRREAPTCRSAVCTHCKEGAGREITQENASARVLATIGSGILSQLTAPNASGARVSYGCSGVLRQETLNAASSSALVRRTEALSATIAAYSAGCLVEELALADEPLLCHSMNEDAGQGGRCAGIAAISRNRRSA